jgi:hypothetical protein
MHEELFADGIGEITVTGSIVRIDFVSLSNVEKDEKGNPRPVFRQRLIMPVEGFANASDVVQKALNGLVEAGVLRRTSDVQLPAPARMHRGHESAQASQGVPGPNSSPNFN